IGVAIYRNAFATGDLPSLLSPEALVMARDTLGAAVDAASKLPADQGARLLEIARHAFVLGMRTVAIICTVVAALAVWMSIRLLRDVPRGDSGSHGHGN